MLHLYGILLMRHEDAHKKFVYTYIYFILILYNFFVVTFSQYVSQTEFCLS